MMRTWQHGIIYEKYGGEPVLYLDLDAVAAWGEDLVDNKEILNLGQWEAFVEQMQDDGVVLDNVISRFEPFTKN